MQTNRSSLNSILIQRLSDSVVCDMSASIAIFALTPNKKKILLHWNNDNLIVLPKKMFVLFHMKCYAFLHSKCQWIL